MDAAIFFSAIGYIVGGIIFGCFTANIAESKGYKGYFATGFFFQIFGLIYLVGLPKSKELVLEEQKQLAALIAEAVIFKQEKE